MSESPLKSDLAHPIILYLFLANSSAIALPMPLEMPAILFIYYNYDCRNSYLKNCSLYLLDIFYKIDDIIATVRAN